VPVLGAVMLLAGPARAEQIGVGSYEVTGIREPRLTEKFKDELDRAFRDAGFELVSLLTHKACPDPGCWAARARAQGVGRFMLPQLEGYGAAGFLVTVKFYEAKNGTQLFRERVEISDAKQSELPITKLVATAARQLGSAGGGSDTAVSQTKRKAQVRVLGLPPGRGVLLNNIPILDPTKPIPVEPGRQRLVISSGEQVRSRDFDVLNGEIYTLEFVSLSDFAIMDQTALAALLELKNLPTDARVTLDGQLLQPKDVHELNAGSHRLVIERLGYEKLDLPFSVGPGQRMIIPVALLPLTETVVVAAESTAPETAADSGLLPRVGLLPLGGAGDPVLMSRSFEAARYAMELSKKIRYVSPENVAGALGLSTDKLRDEIQRCVTSLCSAKALEKAGLSRYVELRLRRSGSDWVVKATLYSGNQGSRIDDVEVVYGGSRADLPWIFHDAVRQILAEIDPPGMTQVILKGAPEGATARVNGLDVPVKAADGGTLRTADVASGVWTVSVANPQGTVLQERKAYLRPGQPYVFDLTLADPASAEPAEVRPHREAAPEPPVKKPKGKK